jgi:serine-type D-Ala-D-Ala carboxypeptidase (penicillin-binding protein 5/6)
VSGPPLRLAAIAAVLLTLFAAIGAGAVKQTGPPPTPVPPRGSLSPFPQVLRTPADASRPPDVDARGALLADLDTGQILYADRPRTARPIASVTKLMTALLARAALPLHRVLRVDPRAEFARDDFGESSTVGLRTGERVRVEDLLYALLLGSANDAAIELAIAVDGSEPAFVSHMNARAASLGMTETHLASASGLDDRGRSTPRDLLTLTRAIEQDPILRSIVDTRFHEIGSPHGRDRVVQNRNALLWLYGPATGMKTGTTRGAGACVVATASRDGRRLVAIVLGAERDAFSPAAALLDYGFDGWRTDTVVAAGASAGVVAIRGGTVPVVAARDLTRLVPVRAVDRTEAVVVDPRAAFPPAPDAPVATLVVRDGDTVLGSVPLIVPDVPPPPPSEGPWWARSADAVGAAIVDAVESLAA